MKAIYLMRHAKSDWSDDGLTDFERPLSLRGQNDAQLIGKQLQKLNFNPTTIVCSPAKRAKATLTIINQQISDVTNSLSYNKSIYESSLENLIFIINSLPTSVQEVAIVGHNPSMSQLANYLVEANTYQFPTCAVLKVALAIDNWNEIIDGVGVQNYFIYPKMFSY